MTPLLYSWQERVKRAGFVRRDMFASGTTFGRTRPSFGDIELTNSAEENAVGDLDFLNDLAVDGRKITVYFGEDTGIFPDDFDAVFTATMEQALVKTDSVTIRVVGNQSKLDLPFQDEFFSGTDSIGGNFQEPGEAEIQPLQYGLGLGGKPKPYAFGKVYNVTPAQVDPNLGIYQVHTGAVDELRVYDRGLYVGGGEDWEFERIPKADEGFSGQAVAFSERLNLFAIAGYQAANESSGIATWSPTGNNAVVERQTNVTGDGYADIAFGQRHFVAVGRQYDGSESPALIRSPDAVTWVETTATFIAPLTAVAYSAPGLRFVVGDNTGNIYYSDDDGFSWTTLSGICSDQINAIIYGGDQFVAVCDDGTIYTSTDGASWVQELTGSSGIAITSVAYSASLGLYAYTADTDVVTTVDFTSFDYFTESGYSFDNIIAIDGFGFTCSAVNAVDRAYIFSTSDAVTWDDYEFPDPAFAIEGLTYGNGWTFVTGRNVTGNITGELYVDEPAANTFNLNDDVATVDAYLKLTDGKIVLEDTNDDALLIYETATGQILLFDVVPTAFNWFSRVPASEFATEAEMLSATLAPGLVKNYRAGGYFRIGGAAEGQVTADVTVGASLSQRTAGAAFVAIMDKLGVDYNSTDPSTLDSSTNYEVGFYTGLTEVIAADLLDQLAESVGAWWGDDRDGVIRFKRLRAPEFVTAEQTFRDYDMIRPLERVASQDPGRGLPFWRVQLNFAKRWTQQFNDFSGFVDDRRRAVLSNEFDSVARSSTAVQDTHPLAKELVIDTLIANVGAAENELDDQYFLRTVKRDRFVFETELNDTTIDLDIGSVVRIVHPRFGLASGKNFAIIGIEIRPDTRTLQLQIWG